MSSPWDWGDFHQIQDLGRLWMGKLGAEVQKNEGVVGIAKMRVAARWRDIGAQVAGGRGRWRGRF